VVLVQGHTMLSDAQLQDVCLQTDDEKDRT